MRASGPGQCMAGCAIFTQLCDLQLAPVVRTCGHEQCMATGYLAARERQPREETGPAAMVPFLMPIMGDLGFRHAGHKYLDLVPMWQDNRCRS